MQSEVLQQLADNNFLECCLDIFIEFCNTKEYKESFDMPLVEPNVCMSVLERRSELEVRAHKGGDVPRARVATLATLAGGRAPVSSGLVSRAADALHNVSGAARPCVADWNRRGLYRLLFRCASWSKGSLEEVYVVRACVCRALFAATAHKCVRASLANTKDCLHSLVATFKPLSEEHMNASCFQAHTQALLVVAALLAESGAADSVWRQLMDTTTHSLLHLLCQCLEIDQIDLQEAALYCLTQLAQSTKKKKHVDHTKDESWIQFYDNIKSPFFIDHENSIRDKNDCQPEYMAEEICKMLINLYQKSTTDIKKYHASQDEHWVSVCSCLSSVLSVSPRTRLYAVHRLLPRLALDSLQPLRDHLSMQGKPADVIRNADYDPVLRTLYWLLTLIDCSMVECAAAKESYAEESLAVTLIRLWPWCMFTEQLRTAVLHLVYTFTNDCPKAWSAVCACAGGHSVLGSVCALAARLAARGSHAPHAPHASHALLPLALATLRHCTQHHHCRAIIIKSEVIVASYKWCVRSRGGGGGGGGGVGAVSLQCGRLVECAARHADGACAAVSLASLPAAAPLRAALLPALAHAAHYHRTLFLQSPDLPELLSGSLLVGDTTEIVCAARAVWALAANNHKAKLMLRSSGVSSAVESALQRVQRAAREHKHHPHHEQQHQHHQHHQHYQQHQRALQLLTYTHAVLQAS